MCSSKRICVGTSVEELFKNDGANDRESPDTVRDRDLYTGKNSAREIETPPLCAICVVEVEADGLEETMVMERSLQRMDQRDGGLSRRRWELMKTDLSLTGKAAMPHTKAVVS
jgi:hypothetical protein